MAANDATETALITALEHMRIVTCFDVATTAILVLDYLLTFDQEIRLIWRSQWNITKILYLTTRYLPFADVILVLWHQLTPDMSLLECSFAYKSTGWMFTISIALAEIILTVRTWAVWGRHRILSWALPIIWIACWAPSFTFMGIFLDSMRFGQFPLPHLQGCLVVAGDPILSWCWVALMIYEGIMFALMAVKAFNEYRNVHADTPHLLSLILKDGILYYTYLFALSIINVIIIRVLPHDFANLLSLFERVIHSILTCRVINHIRQQAKTEIPGTTVSFIGDLGTVTSGSLSFRSNYFSRGVHEEYFHDDDAER